MLTNRCIPAFHKYVLAPWGLSSTSMYSHRLGFTTTWECFPFHGEDPSMLEYIGCWFC